MELHRQRHYLTMTTACLLLFSAAIVVWSVSAIDVSTPQYSSTNPVQAVTPETSESPEPTIPTSLTKRSLRGPLYDPEPTPPSPPKPRPPTVPRSSEKPKFNLSLVGTIIESNNSLAIIADPDGQFDVKAVGETLELAPAGIVITSIQAEQVTLTHQGKTTTLKLERQQQKSKGVNGNRNNRKRGLK